MYGCYNPLTLRTRVAKRWQPAPSTAGQPGEPNLISKPQSLFTYGFSSRYGGYYANGTRLNLTADLGYRFQPYVSLAASASYNDIRLPQPWGHTTFWLVGPRFDLTLTNKLYLTTFVQYNEQQKNMNVNARVQWRYKPASDFFLVYTDNYLPNSAQIGQDVPGFLSVKNRALVLEVDLLVESLIHRFLNKLNLCQVYLKIRRKSNG